MAPFRIADCLWMEGDHAAAAKAYARLREEGDADDGDVALARFRIAEERRRAIRPAPAKQFLAIAREFPGAPARPTRRCAGRRRRPRPPPRPATKRRPPPPPAADGQLSVPDRLRRAESLTRDRHWDEALAELAALPADAAARGRRPSATTRSG